MRFLLTISFLIGAVAVFGQRLNVRGTVVDTLGQPLIGASVMLLEKDSSLVDFIYSGNDGGFTFRGVDPGFYLLKASYVGYIPLTIALEQDRGSVDLGQLKMTEIDARIMEVVIKAAKAPMSIRGDTIEYDASQFKVPEGSSLEDLLRRLPGVQVDMSGNLKSEGLNVTKLTVDGKTFFSEDPKIAIKTLPAEAISKIQVFDRKTEDQRAMGDKSSAEEKEMNVALKEDFKKGGFGKVTAGLGSEDTKELKGNYNRFDPKQQVSIIGVGNNTGRNGLNWNDYEDFFGSASWNFSFLDYGFRTSDGMIFTFGGGNDLEGGIGSNFFSRNQGGFPSKIATGVNYNYDHQKNRLKGTYIFDKSGNTRDRLTSMRTFLPDQTSLSQGNTAFDDQSDSHKFDVDYERKIDSLTSIQLNASYTSLNRTNLINRMENVKRNDEIPISENLNDNSTTLDGESLRATLVFKKEFKKSGRVFRLNGTMISSDIVNSTINNADLSFFDASGAVDSVFALRQNILSDAQKRQQKVNAMYNEPLSKNFSLNVFYNLNAWNQEGLFLATDVENGNRTTNLSLSRSYDNALFGQRIGSTLTYNVEALNISAGYGRQQINLRGDYRGVEGSDLVGSIDQNFSSWLSSADISYQINRTTRFSTAYIRVLNEPSINSLLPLVNNLNPLFIEVGNQELLPEVGNRFSASFRKTWPVSGISFNINGSFTDYDTRIIQKQTVDQNLVTTVQPINFDGGSRFSSWMYVNLPIVEGILSTSYNVDFSRNQDFTLVNDVVNNTVSRNTGFGVSLDFTPSEKFGLMTNVDYGFTKTIFDINSSQNQNITKTDVNTRLNYKAGRGFMVSGEFEYSMFRNDRFGGNLEVPIFNLSISKQVLKDNKGEIRLSLYDAFDNNRQINQSASMISVSESITTSLARYVMLSFSYNFRGINRSVDEFY